MAQRRITYQAQLRWFRNHMRPYKTVKRISTINNAFASALAMADEYNEQVLIEKLTVLGQVPGELMRCVFCGRIAETVDHLHGLVEDSMHAGHGHVIGNLVPCCTGCNSSKRNTPWRKFAASAETPAELQQRIADYEKLAPPPMSEADLADLYPDLMRAYSRLRLLCHDLLRTADNLAREIQSLEKRRLGRGPTGETAAD